MAVKVRDLFQLNTMKDFRLVAGEKGLDGEIVRTEILDYEFLREGREFRRKSFEGDSLVLSSFLFARDDPDLVTAAVKQLRAFNCKALAYKPVIVRELPEEAIRYADEVGFPILVFGDSDAFFEDIIIEVGEHCRKVNKMDRARPLIETMLRRPLSDGEKKEALEFMNPNFRRLLCCHCLNVGEEALGEVVNALEFARRPKDVENRAFAGLCRDRVFLITSFDEEEPAGRGFSQDPLAEDAALFLRIDPDRVTAGSSVVHPLSDGPDDAVREAYWSEIAAEVFGKKEQNFSSLGMRKLLIPWSEGSGAERFMREYLSPILDGENETLLATAVQYVLADGDPGEAAVRLFCHKNTVRYRVDRLREKLDPDAQEKVFFMHLASAVTTYLLFEQAAGNDVRFSASSAGGEA
ncbi:MAG: PucR family transcriptional regulator [Anaerovoracaceae bacterium]|jgi:hypothetical protein